MKRVRTRLGAALAAMAMGASVLVAMGGTAHAVTSNPPNPQLTFAGTQTSHPFPGAPGTASDIEGLGYVPSDTSMWVADDNADRVWEINPSTGAYRSQLKGGSGGTDFLAATNESSGVTCGATVDPTYFAADGVTPIDTAALECLSRTDDFESVVYDPSGDVLYVTSGNCCNGGLPTVYRYVDDDNNPVTPPVLQPTSYPFNPTVWKLTRVGGHFKPTSWQALPEGEDPTAAGWRPGTGMYYGKNGYLRTYDFATNAIGSKITSGLPSDIVGVDFTDASTAFITTASKDTSTGRTTATSDSTIRKYTFNGSGFSLATGWTFPLKSVGNPAAIDQAGMIDARDLAIVGDTFYVSDGYDFRASGDHPIYVYTLGSAPAVASFTSVQQSAPALYTVQFTDTTVPAGVSTTPPTSWAWDFDNNGTTDATTPNPLHVFNAPGTYNVKLTVTNAAGSFSTPPQPVVVTGPKWTFETVNAASQFGGGNALMPYGAQIQAFYADNSHGSLGHSWRDSTGWHVEVLDGAGKNTNDSVGKFVTAIQYGAQIQLLYSDATTHSLRHAWWDGIRWNTETLDGAGGANGRTTHVVANGTISYRQVGAQVQAFYSDDTAHTLRHAWWDGIRWNFENLPGASSLPSSGTYVASTQVGSTLHVLSKTSAGDLERNWISLTGGAVWNNQTVDGAGGGGGRTSHAVGDYVSLIPSANGLDAFYQDVNDSSLRHAKLSGSTWSFETLDGSGGSISGHTNNAVGTQIAAIGYGGGLHVIYHQDDATGVQRHAWFDSAGWHVEVLDGVGSVKPGASSSANTGLSNAMMVYSGQLHVSYFDAANGGQFRHSFFG